MKVTGVQIGELTELICDKFSPDDLKYVLHTKLEIKLDIAVSTKEALRTVAYDLIVKLDQEDRLVEFVRVFKIVRPNSPDVIKVCDPILGANGQAPPVSLGVLREKIEAFNSGFNGRNQILGYLAGYKGLHDVLHKLKLYQTDISAAAAARVADPSVPLKYEVRLFLQDHVRLALDSLAETEFPKRMPKWIEKLSAAAEELAGLDVAKIRRADKQLAGLPSNDLLQSLNDKLIEYALQLKIGEMIGSLDGILTALASESTGVRSQVEEFRNLCAELEKLVLAHDLCQKIDYDLNQVTELRPVKSDDPSEWVDAKESLSALASQRPGDERVSRTYDAARLFEAANQGKEFESLKVKFDDLFKETDDALLRLTGRLPRRALQLHNTLENIR